MPYIEQKRREKFLGIGGYGRRAKNAGELNYLIFKILLEYLKQHGMCYQTFNDIMGVLSGADKEFYRRLTQFYEGVKIEENGDVLSAEDMRELSFD